MSRQPIDLVAFAETYDIPAELDVYHWAQLLVSGIREATDRKEITCFRDGRTELPVVALQLIAEFMPSSRSADVGFRFDRGVMTEVSRAERKHATGVSLFRINVRLSVQRKCHSVMPRWYQMMTPWDPPWILALEDPRHPGISWWCSGGFPIAAPIMSPDRLQSPP